MDIRIGITQSPKEIQVELADDYDVEKLTAMIEDSLASGSGVFWLTDIKGRRVAVAAAKVAYVEVGSADADRRVGFGSAVR